MRIVKQEKQMQMMAKIKTLLVDSKKRVLQMVLSITAVSVVVLVSMASANGEGLSNKYCPVTTSELAEEQFLVDYQGQQIYFCCNNCKRDFLADPEAYLANLKTSGEDQSQDHDEVAHEHGNEAAEVGTEGHEVNADASHDHATDHGEPSSLVSYIGKFHPMVTHFPIALVLSALLFSAMAFVFQVQTFDIVSVYSVYVAAVSGLLTVALGLVAGYGASYPSFLTGYLATHRLLGILTGILTFATAYLGYRQLQTKSTSSAWLYRGSLLANSILVGITGHFGATLVFGPDNFDF